MQYHTIPRKEFKVIDIDTLKKIEKYVFTENLCSHYNPGELWKVQVGDDGDRDAEQPAEQGTFFIADPDGNALEFKAPRRDEALFD